MSFLCKILSHSWVEGAVIRRTNELVNQDFRKVFVILSCGRCGLLKEAARAEIDRFKFPNGVEDYLK